MWGEGRGGGFTLELGGGDSGGVWETEHLP